jgi:hypothetical protein
MKRLTIKKWWCKRFGHNWMVFHAGEGFEYDNGKEFKVLCTRCWAERRFEWT